jgi:hypothetical protein
MPNHSLREFVHSCCGINSPTSNSTLTGSIEVVQPNLRESLPKWVSTVIPGIPNACPRTTLAVLRPTPEELPTHQANLELYRHILQSNFSPSP